MKEMYYFASLRQPLGYLYRHVAHSRLLSPCAYHGFHLGGLNLRTE
ncbi:unnamed protein product [Periconia digitata]|uniref:Uncharacterized protein n=1 Tax=Periconia digitata TaxID=1303443 RepID=A0A9W4XII1_9PLEO|nr:unnamed protein product [Periconia digitata]